MCWETRLKPYLKECTADKDIPTFKIVRQNPFTYGFRPIYYPNGITYVVGVPMHLLKPMVLENDTYANSVVINQGFHSYHASDVTTEFSGICIWVIADKGRGMTLDHISHDGIYYKMSCVIPKGAHYYKNERGEFVSDSILPIDSTFIGKIDMTERRKKGLEQIDKTLNKIL